MNSFFTLLVLVLPAFAAPVTRDFVPGSFIVKFTPGANVTKTTREEWVTNTLASGGASISSVQLDSARLTWEDELFNGFASTLTSAQVKVLQTNPSVAWVRPNQVVRIAEIVTQTNAPWGLSRISAQGGVDTQNGQRNAQSLTFPYTFDSQAGRDVDVYIVDTGIRTTHVEFGGRASTGASFVPGEDFDGNGHGTHVAGTVAGNNFGVAKLANVIDVKVMNNQGSGATDGILAGLNFIFQQAQASGRPSVVNMSIGGGTNQALDDAATALTEAGIHVVVAAGNENQDASNSSPARAPAVITVGATNIDDEIAGFSNFGAAVDVLAPGQDIISASFQADDQAASLSGTSMACPHVAGFAAYLLSLEGQRSPQELRDRILELSLANEIGAIKPNTVSNIIFNNANAADATQTGRLGNFRRRK